MRRTCSALALPISALLLAGCGGGSDDGPSAAAPSSSSSSAAAPSTTSSVSTPTSSSAASSSSSSSATSSSATSSSAGPAPGGSAIKAGAASKLPAKVGVWTTMAGTDPTIKIYKNGNGDLISASFSGTAQYSLMVTAITQQKVKAGTGMCGETSTAGNEVCYLKAADGTLTVTADGSEVPQPTLVAFVNQLTTALGTS